MTFRRGESTFEAVVGKVLEDGCLVLDCAPPDRFRHGEVEWVVRTDEGYKG
jgi:hypothetical protein